MARKLVNSTYITLDGVVEGPHLWPPLPLGSAAEHEDVQAETLKTCDVLLMGRRTYDVFAPVWPTRSDPFATRLNEMRKVVASRTLTDPEWANTEVFSTGVAERVAALKAESGGDIIQYGVGSVTRLMMEHGLLDELTLWVYPQFVRGTAADLLFEPDVAATLDLIGTRGLSNGIVVLRYAVRSADVA
ncbi:dihydrofolate reductase family protein [Solicola gregarius]|uniref:Dihydrofolate reductase family protein n=1 Tax=Solicola gregarius TaxID=2908642 RepID=A0AA46TJA1_9ACTN|nr:dihydrofolate reductase family protein [Solicola gregarius]UYM05882.1 dihydrofolate reductase family protein [Solicola gregarius]